MKEDTKPTVETPLNADYYVTPKKLHPYDLKSAQQLTQQPVWVKAGYYHTYYPYNTAMHKTDFAHEAGLLGPAAKARDQGRGNRCISQNAGNKASYGDISS